MRYDPTVDPDPAQWLAAPEAERLVAVRQHHELAGHPPEGAQAHAAIHTVVETQLAEEYAVTQATLRRLVHDGLDRHDAIHAIGSVVADEILDMLKLKRAYEPEAYARKLAALTAAAWRRGLQ